MSDASSSRRVRAQRRALFRALAVLAATSVHHVYGAIRYDTPWRLHAPVIGAVLALVLFGAFRLGQAGRDGVGRPTARWLFVAVNGLFFVLLIGAYEGLYNHVLKVALHLAGTPVPWMRVLFPAPMYELPNDWFFEVTGMLQVVPAALTAVWLVRSSRRQAVP